MRRGAIKRSVRLLAVAAFAAAGNPGSTMAEPKPALRGGGDGIADPVDGLLGEASRGRAVVLDRARGNCLICHAVPEPNERFMGDLGPPLQGVGARLTVAQLRLRLIDQRVINAKTIMPPYYATNGLKQVAAQYRDKTVLTAQDIEDAVAYLATLKATLKE